MNELDEFLSTVLPRQIEAEEAIHNGDPAPRLSMWSHNDPVTILGAFGIVSNGWAEVNEISRWIASRFSNCTAYDFELVTAGVSGDLAYTVGYERSKLSLDGGPIQSNMLRVTHVYRREDGEWKIVHRHGDGLSTDKVPSQTS